MFFQIEQIHQCTPPPLSPNHLRARAGNCGARGDCGGCGWHEEGGGAAGTPRPTRAPDPVHVLLEVRRGPRKVELRREGGWGGGQ